MDASRPPRSTSPPRLPVASRAILVDEGDFVEAGQVLAEMQVESLQAQLNEATAQKQRAVNAVDSARALVMVRESEKRAAEALVTQRESEVEAAQRRFERTETLSRTGAATAQDIDNDRVALQSTRAAVSAAQAQVAAAAAAIEAARADVIGAGSAVTAAEATIARIQSDINDGQLKAPRAGRVQYLVAQAGEVLGAGGKVLNLVDLSDVYMTFFVPETVAGRIALDSEVRIILDALPDRVVPARVSFVASTAQFTPKTVETASERQKLMFRVKARIDRQLLLKYLKLVKTGLPGVAWIKLDEQTEWPAHLVTNVPE